MIDVVFDVGDQALELRAICGGTLLIGVIIRSWACEIEESALQRPFPDGKSVGADWRLGSYQSEADRKYVTSISAALKVRIGNSDVFDTNRIQLGYFYCSLNSHWSCNGPIYSHTGTPLLIGHLEII